MLAVTDAAIAAQNAVVAAESFGIGSCYIGDIMENCDTQRSLLHLPDYVFPAVMLVFGWPTQQQKDRVKPQRCAMEHIVHENGYRTMDGAELRDTFGYKAGNAPFDQWCTAFCNRKYNSDFSKEMTRSVEEYLASSGNLNRQLQQQKAAAARYFVQLPLFVYLWFSANSAPSSGRISWGSIPYSPRFAAARSAAAPCRYTAQAAAW